MIAALGSWLTPTRGVGLASFGSAAVVSGMAWSHLARHAASRTAPFRLPMILTLIHSFFFFDIVFNLRWQLHQALQEAAMADRLYDSRRTPQTLVLLALALTFTLGCVWLVQREWRRKGAALALLGTALGLGSWCMEVVSLHAVDRLLYETKGPLMAVAIIWILVGLMTTAGVWVYSKTTRPAGA